MSNDKEKKSNPITVYIDKLQNLMLQESNYERLKKLAPKHLSLDTLVEAAKLEILLNPDLIECSQKSMFYALLECVRLGMLPSKTLGRVYIIPYNNNKKVGKDKYGKDQWKTIKEATFILGYKGMIDLIYRHPYVAKLQTDVVYKNDYFDVDDRGKIHHKRNEDVPPTFLELSSSEKKKFHMDTRVDPKSIRAVYLRVWRKDCDEPLETYFVKWQIEKKYKDTPAWRNHYGKMAMKSLLRDTYYELPSSTEFVDIRHENQSLVAVYEGTVVDDDDNNNDKTKPKTKAQKMAEQLTADNKDENTEPKALDDAAAFEKGCDDVFGEDTR